MNELSECGSFPQLHYPFIFSLLQGEKMQPELMLCYAILERAIVDVVDPKVTKEFKRTARGWFYQKSYRPYGFLWICQQLGMSAEHIKRFVMSYEAAGAADLLSFRKPVGYERLIRALEDFRSDEPSYIPDRAFKALGQQSAPL